MTVLKNIQKSLKAHHLLALLGLLALAVAIGQFSSRKAAAWEGAVGGRASVSSGTPQPSARDRRIVDAPNTGSPKAANPAGQNEVYASAKGLGGPAQGLAPSCVQGATTAPGDLLPKDTNNQWGRLNPSGGGALSNVNLLKAGYHSGIDTVGSTLRNANLQVRSEPPNPTTRVSPWMNTTIEPDLMRTPLEIGCGPQ